jgi:hypothetical protein
LDNRIYFGFKESFIAKWNERKRETWRNNAHERSE